MGNNKWPLVSVVMPAKEPDRFFKLALKSILEQSYKNIETIIAVDQDKLELFESAFQNENIRYVGSKFRGLGPALNKAIEESRGEFIARMDADDFAHPDRIEKQISILMKDRTIDVVVSNAAIIDENGIPSGKKIANKCYSRFEIIECLKYKNVIAHPTAMISVVALRNVGGYTPRASEDFDLWHRIIAAKPRSIVMIDECLIDYRIHSSQLSALTRAKSRKAVCVVLFDQLLESFSAMLAIGVVLNLGKYYISKIKEWIRY